MGKRVLIGTSNRSESPERSSFFSGQMTPFIRGHGPPVDGVMTWVQMPLCDPENDLAFTIDRALHRTRLMSFECDAVASAGGRTVSFPAGTPATGYRGPALNFSFSAFVDERDYAKVGVTQIFNQSGSFPADATQYSIAIYIFADFDNPIRETPVIYLDEDSGLYYVPISVSGFLNVTTDIDGNRANIQLSSDSDSLGEDISGSFTALVIGKPITVFYSISTTGDGSASVAGLTAGTSPDGEGFWAYAYLNGDPVWKMDTGAREQPNRPPQT
jgi:hypothetical protein